MPSDDGTARYYCAECNETFHTDAATARIEADAHAALHAQIETLKGDRQAAWDETAYVRRERASVYRQYDEMRAHAQLRETQLTAVLLQRDAAREILRGMHHEGSLRGYAEAVAKLRAVLYAPAVTAPVQGPEEIEYVDVHDPQRGLIAFLKEANA